jgi:hypothetical protein
MPKVDVDTLKRPRPVTKQFRFTDPSNPGVEIELNLRPLDPIEDEKALEYANQLSRRWLTGGFFWEDRQEWRKDPIPLHAQDGVPIAVNERALTIVARLEKMQGEPLPEDAYTAEEFLRIAVSMPEAWSGIQAAYWSLLSGEEGWQGKGSREPSA